ncbi:MAG: Lrp/AsnC family transcriptional regulator [Burkholderiaceae bacterium]|nr:Lrp/AsnC family transcriptional regulator [Burkholderiaceae bacterium]
MTNSLQLDDKAWRILQALQLDGRAPLKQLAQEAGLSLPATAERLKRLQEAGVISGIHAQLNAVAVGYGVRAIIGITALQPGKRPLLEHLRRQPEVLECHHVTGADSYLMTVVAPDMKALEALLEGMNKYGETRTSIVMSTPIPARALRPPV